MHKPPQYEVTVDFNDQALKTTRVVNGLTELGLYLERVPSMTGFELNGEATVTIKKKGITTT